MAGYCGWSKSNNAVAAEAEGRLPLTRAIAKLASDLQVTRAAARKALEAIGPCEWHHTSKRFNCTNYYDLAQAAALLSAGPAIEQLEAAGFRERLTTALSAFPLHDTAGRRVARQSAVSEIAAETGIDATIIVNAYYGDWSGA